MNDVVEWAPSMIESAKKEQKKFLESGEIDGNLLQACIVLAQTDVVFRVLYKGYFNLVPFYFISSLALIFFTFNSDS